MIDALISNAGTVSSRILTVIASFIVAFVFGRSKGKATAVGTAKVEKVEAEKRQCRPLQSIPRRGA